VRRVDVDVLVVGAGPAGLTASLLLARHGLTHRVVDRRIGPHRAPQAHVVNPRSLEIFRQMSLDTMGLRRMATPRADGGWVAWNTTLAGAELGRLPYERQGDDALAFTPEPIINLSQHVLEPVLLEHVTGDTVRWAHEWCGLTQDASGVTSRVRDLEAREDYEVRSRWVLAADGAGSPVRKALAVPMVGPDRLQTVVMVHFEANLRSLVRDRPAILYWILDPECLGSFVAHDIDRSWVFMRPVDAADESAEAYDAARAADVVRRAIGRDDVELRVLDVSTWHMTSQIAGAYRAGRVFLVGDSAHRFPPAGGMGMNTGIQDAHNLVWKLRWVEQGRAAPALLDTYEVERRPVAQHNADQSLMNALRMLESIGELGLGGDIGAARAQLAALVESPEGRARVERAIEAQREHFDMVGLQLGFRYETGAVVPDGTVAAEPGNAVSEFIQSGRPGGRMPHAWLDAERKRSSLDLLAGDTFTLLAGPDGEAWEAAARGLGDTLRVLVADRDFDDIGGVWRNACGIGRDGAVLVRPDQHVAWRAQCAPGGGRTDLASVLTTLLGRSPRS
jgi:2,4-dichlorophenol 6-monooxygenase